VFSASAGCHGDFNRAAHQFSVSARRVIFVRAVSPLASIDFQLLDVQFFRRQLQSADKALPSFRGECDEYPVFRS
jgi:hypothetical protein